MHPDRIADLLQPFLDSPSARSLTEKDPAIISTYIDILIRWNARINLTAICDLEQIVTRHFGESLFTARHLFPRNPSGPSAAKARFRVADVGSGAGFPGIPIKIWHPDIFLTLIESSQKKATFLREVCRALALQDVHVENVRAETMPKASFDVVTLRAVERFENTLLPSARILVPSGRLALLISSRQLATAYSVLKTFSWDQPVTVPCSSSRLLLIGTKES